MKPDAVSAMLAGLRDGQINFVASVPCTAFAEVIPAVRSDPAFTHVEATNEGDAVSICAGARLGGKRPVLLAENSGLVLGAYALRNLENFGGFPILLVLDHRGDFGEGDGHWYFPTGMVAPSILRTLQIPYGVVEDNAGLRDAVARGAKTAEASRRPAAVLLGAGVR